MGFYFFKICALSWAQTIALTYYRPEYLTSYWTVLSAFLTVQLFISVAYTLWIYPFFLSPLRHLPGPRTKSWIFGEFRTIMKEPSGFPHARWTAQIPNDGVMRYLGLFNRERLMVTRAKTLQEVLQKNPDVWAKPREAQLLKMVLGARSLFFSESNDAKRHRKILSPAFGHGHLRNLVPIFWEKAVELGDRIAKETKSGTEQQVNISRLSALATLDIIGEAGFGYDFKALKSDNTGSELAGAYMTFFRRNRGVFILRTLSLIFPGWLVYSAPSPASLHLKAAQKTIKRVCKDLVLQKQQAIRDGKSGKDILSVMLQSGEYNTPDGMEVAQDQIMTFLAAGHETTASALGWAIHLLTTHPDRQTALRNDIRNAFPGGPSSPPTYEQLDSVKSLRHFCDEALRFYPPVAITFRKSNAPTILNGMRIPPNTLLVVVPWALHRDPSVWGEDADQFRPERWEDKNSKGLESNYNFQTFLSGPRSCIGKEFAAIEFRALLVGLLARFEFEGTSEKVEVEEGITMGVKGGLRVKVKEVPGWA